MNNSNSEKIFNDESKIKLNLADLPNGNYFIKISSGKNVTVKKIVVIK